MAPMSVTPVKSASILLLRDCPPRADGGCGFEVLTMTRPGNARFAPGATVFPGGKLDEADRQAARACLGEGDGEQPGLEEMAARIAAIRELTEETGISLEGEDASRRLVKIGHWITPPAQPIRFDTFFYLALAPEGQEPHDQSDEATRIDWLTPDAALAPGSGHYLMLPTRMHFLLLQRFRVVAEVFDYARTAPVQPVIPTPEERDGRVWLTIPEAAGYGVTEVPLEEVAEFSSKRA